MKTLKLHAFLTGGVSNRKGSSMKRILFLVMLLVAHPAFARCNGKLAARFMTDSSLAQKEKESRMASFGCDAVGLSVVTAGDKEEQRAFNANQYRRSQAEIRNKPEAVEDYRTAMAKQCGGKYPQPLRNGLREADLLKGCSGLASVKAQAGAVKTYAVGWKTVTVKSGRVVDVKTR
jgi:hypothetical protein